MRASFAALLLAFPFPAMAYDSSGGARIKELLSRVTFQESLDVSLNPTLFQWNDSTRGEFLRRLETAMSAMPLDVAEIPRDAKIIVSNAVAVCPDPVHARLLRMRPGAGASILSNIPGLETLATEAHQFKRTHEQDCFDRDSYWDSPRREMDLSGWSYLETIRRSGEGETEEFESILLHEFTHALGGSPPSSIQAFLGLYEKRAEAWNRVMRPHLLWQEERMRQRERGELSWDSLKADVELLETLRKSHYRKLKLPSRWDQELDPDRTVRAAGLTQARDPKGALDTHAMQHCGEYLAVLAELLWKRPAVAAAYYSPEEIAWVKRHVFGGRLDAPAPGVSPSLNTVLQAEKMQGMLEAFRVLR